MASGTRPLIKHVRRASHRPLFSSHAAHAAITRGGRPRAGTWRTERDKVCSLVDLAPRHLCTSLGLGCVSCVVAIMLVDVGVLAQCRQPWSPGGRALPGKGVATDPCSEGGQAGAPRRPGRASSSWPAWSRTLSLCGAGQWQESDVMLCRVTCPVSQACGRKAGQTLKWVPGCVQLDVVTSEQL